MLNQAGKKEMLLFQYEYILTKAMKTCLLLSILLSTCIRCEKDFLDHYSYRPPEFTNEK